MRFSTNQLKTMRKKSPKSGRVRACGLRGFVLACVQLSSLLLEWVHESCHCGARFTQTVFDAIFVALSNATLVALELAMKIASVKAVISQKCRT